METRRLLLFDIDGTVLLCRGRGIRAMHQAIERLFGAPATENRILPMGKTDPILFEEVGASHGVSPAELWAQPEILYATYVEVLAASLREPGACEPKPGAAVLLAALADRGDVVLGLVTGNLERAARLKLAAVGLEHYFVDGAFGSDGRRRSDLVGLALERFAARERLRFQPQRVWVIGDTPDDVASGRAHGTRTLAVATGGFGRDELARCGPDVVLDSLVDTVQVVDILCSAN